mgnify:CR=1 FL=1
MENQEKKKTHTSTAVKARYNKKTYQQYTVSFRKKEDADCIEYIETQRSKGYTTAEIFKYAIRNINV